MQIANSCRLVFFLLLVSVVSNASTYQKECTVFKSPRAGIYCIYKAVGSKNTDVLYLFHGLTETVYSWDLNPRIAAMKKYWQDNGIDGPTVAAISFGPAWLLSGKNSGHFSGLYDVVVDNLMPAIEAKLGGIKGRRLLLGESMGGFNATQLLLKNPELFDKVALGCPAMAELSPFSPWHDIYAYIRRTNASAFDVLKSVFLAAVFFPTVNDWLNASPFEKARAKLGPDTPPVYISIGMQDQYGFNEGAEAFAQIAAQQGVKDVTFDPVSGGHCSMNSQAIAKFLSPL